MSHLPESPIDGFSPTDPNLGQYVLYWISLGKRPFTVKELQHVCAMKYARGKLNSQDLRAVERSFSTFGSLITVDEPTQVVGLGNLGENHFEQQAISKSAQEIQLYLALKCISYLSLESMNSGYAPDNASFERRLAEYPFLDYAAHWWAAHVKELQLEHLDRRLKILLLSFLMNDDLVACASQVQFTKIWDYSEYSQASPRNVSGLHLAAYFGLSDICADLISPGSGCINVNARDSNGQTPLAWAAKQGHGRVVRLLLDCEGIEPDAVDILGDSPLSLAAASGHSSIVGQLLSCGNVDADRRGNLDLTPLLWAATNGHEAAVRAVIEYHDINGSSMKQYASWALYCAASSGHVAIVQLLLYRNDVDIYILKDGRTAMAWAGIEGHQAVLDLLQEHERLRNDTRTT